MDAVQIASETPPPMKSPLRSHLVAVFAVILSAGVPAQEKLALPDDPLAAIARMPAQEPAKEGKRVQVVDENGKPLAGVSVVAVPVADKRDQSKLAAWLKRVTEKHGPSWDLDKAQQLYYAIRVPPR